MRTISVTQNQPIYQRNKPNFKSIYYQGNSYRDVHGVKRETQNSTCKRNDLNYQRLAEISKERFSGFDKVNIMPMNVSDGTESYFLLKYFIEENGYTAFDEKYNTIVATDVCGDVINKYPEKFLVHLFSGEPDELNVYGYSMFKQVEESCIDKDSLEPLYNLNPRFRKYFKFGVMDFQQRLGNMNDEGNSIVLIRNCLKQSFGDIKSALIAYQLASKLKGASLFVTGNYDRGMRLFESAMDDNFVEIEHNIWARKDYQQNLKKTVVPVMPDVSLNIKNNGNFLGSLKRFIKH